MNQKFSRKELERLGCTEEEIKLVIKCQKILPIVLDNGDNNNFCVNTRTLWEQLYKNEEGVVLESKTEFKDWIPRKIKKGRFVENIDFFTEAQKISTANGGYTESKEYIATIRMAEHLCMMQNNDNGFMMRDYFCLMEKLVKRNKDWWGIRNPQKENYKPMCNAISESIHRVCGRYGDDYDFKREADIINQIAVGSRAQSIKNYLGINTNAITRDNLLADYNEKISFLQDQNVLLLGMDMPIIQRVKMLIAFFDTKYPNAMPIQDYHDRDYMIKARENIINELETR